MPLGAAEKASSLTVMGDPPVSALPSAITIGIDTPEAMAAVATTVAHVPLLKIKVNRDEAAAQIAAVRAAAPAPRLIVDPNESWRVEDIAAYLPLLRAQRVDLLEQPVPADDDEGLAALAGAIPICADEALHTRDHLDRLAGRSGDDLAQHTGSLPPSPERHGGKQRNDTQERLRSALSYRQDRLRRTAAG